MATEPEKASYYDISMLQPPVWTPEVGIYFFLGGLSGGAYALARVGERIDREKYRDLTQVGVWTAVAAALPCAPLLIKDLGDPRRFHHMLRIWKPDSPMNLGSWTLTSYSGALVIAALREWLKTRPEAPPAALDRVLGVVADGGVPLGLLLAGYSGVLLSTTAVPLWGRNPWIGPLFMVGGFSSGAAAVRLALKAARKPASPADPVLKKIGTISHAAEALSIYGFLKGAGEFAKPLVQGGESGRFWGGAVALGLVVPTILEGLPAKKKTHQRLSLVAAAAALLGVFFMRMAILGAGRESASDPEAARRASRPQAAGGAE